MTRAALGLALAITCVTVPHTQSRAGLPPAVVLSSGWLMQDVAHVTAGGDTISTPAFAPEVYTPKPYVPPPTASANPQGTPGANQDTRPLLSSHWQQAPGPSSSAWYRATVPGTVLTTLVNNNIYPDPMYGENNRPNIIPESLCRTSYWFRAEMTVPATFGSRRVWLNFDGINYMADVWVNGAKVGDVRGAFARGQFDITSHVTPGKTAVIAVLIKPPLIPGDPEEKTQLTGLGINGGVMSKDGPAFIATQGWDWVPGIRDRDMGIWQKVSLSATGPVVIRDARVVTDLPLPRLDSADVSIDVPIRNVGESSQTGVVSGSLGNVKFKSAPITLAVGESRTVKLASDSLPALRLKNPKLWWPNGFGDPNLYLLRLTFETGGVESDATEFNVGIRELGYQAGASENLVLIVNGVRVFAKGGSWGLDDAMKRVPRERLDVMMRFQREANYTIVRNWVGQSTSEDFYDLADRYGLMIWDEFFQPYAGLDAGRADGESGENDITDVPMYLANARDKVLRFRNHPSIVLWCGRNEGDPAPKALAAALESMMAELDPTRLYQKNSDAGRGVRSGGPYYWQPPQAYYGEGRGGRGALTPFKTELGSLSIPTIESIYGMMPAADAERFPNDVWAEHDFAAGRGDANQAGTYIETLRARYGPVDTLPKFVRAAQLANYEAFRALYEGRLAKLFDPANAVITWMSNPAQPSFTWQIYSHDLEPFGSFFGARKACEPVHVMLNERDGQVMIVNHTPQRLRGLSQQVTVINLDGFLAGRRTTVNLDVEPGSATGTGPPEASSQMSISNVHFVKLELRDEHKRLISSNFYWRNRTDANDLTALNGLPSVALRTSIKRRSKDGKVYVDVTLENPAKVVALMTHLQLRNARTNQRVLPVFYSDNYISLVPGEKRTLTVEAAVRDLGPEAPILALDGWNIIPTILR